MESSEKKKPTKRSTTQSRQFVNRQSKSTAKTSKPTKRTDVVRPKVSASKRVSRTQQAAVPKRGSHAKASTTGRRTSTARSGSSYSSRASARKPATNAERRDDFIQRITSSRLAIVVVAIVAVLVLVGGIDAAANWGKAYGNVSVNGLSVGGMNSEQIVAALQEEYGSRVSHAQVTIYANEEAERTGGKAISQEELEATAEQISVEEANERVQFWDVDALTLKGTLPYEQVAQQALAVGREDGGIGKRFGLLISAQDIPIGVDFDDGRIEELASQIDLTIGDPRIDTTVVVLDGKASSTEGHAGMLVDRGWLKGKLSDAMMSGEATSSFVAEATESQSRISKQQADDMAACISRAIENGVNFKYEGRNWLASPAMLSNWTEVNIVGEEGDWKLEPVINASLAVPDVVKNAKAEITADDMTVTFEASGSDVWVHTSGTGNIPEVSAAVEQMQEALFGQNGIAWGSGTAEAPTIEITETDRPETLSFDDALNMGIISVIGQYTTEFSNLEGTENRNHNIKLCADLFNNNIVDANGGTWEFNDRSGDTNEEAGFWTAGSIVDGEYQDSVGGGICQVATTVFNAVLESGMEVLERHNHTLYIGSYPTGRDAAVDYPSDLDLIWKNSLESQILMKTSYTDTSITVKLYSVSTGYEAEFELGAWQEGEKYVTLFEHDSSMGDGQYYRKTVGSDGSKIDLMRYVTDEKGNAVRTDAFQSNYKAKDEVYVIGDNVDTSKLVRSTS